MKRLLWWLKQQLAKPGRYYGGDGTIHGTMHVDVETDRNGRVVSVWYRCSMLPFHQTTVDRGRATDMNNAYQHHEMPGIRGIEFEDVEHRIAGRRSVV